MSSFFFLLLLFSAVTTTPDAGTIIKLSVQANAADFKAQSEYSYITTEKSGDSDTKTYEVFMMLGSPYRRLIGINGYPLRSDAERRETEKMQRALEERRRESPGERQGRVSKYLKEKQQENLMMSEMTRAFRFRLLGTQKLRGHAVYVFDATPNPDYQPINAKAKVLAGMRGKLWIEAGSYHWVRVEAEVSEPVYFEGFLARVDPGTKFVLDKEPVGDGYWMPARFEMKVNSKILGFISHNASEQNTFSQYRRSDEVARGPADLPGGL
jgi:hypothetical protein